MTIIKTSELTGAALDWAVAKCEGLRVVYHDDGITRCIMKLKDGCERLYAGRFAPSSDWAQGGPIVERKHIAVWWDGTWHAKLDGCKSDEVQDAYEPLIAAMRCYVASKLGDSVDVPDALGPNVS